LPFSNRPSRHPQTTVNISPTVSDFALDDSVLELAHEVVAPSKPPHLTRSQASKLFSPPIIASSSCMKLDVSHRWSPENHSRQLPERIFLSDNESVNEKGLATIHVKTRQACSSISTAGEFNDFRGEQALHLGSRL
jgi:hypothetical protein